MAKRTTTRATSTPAAAAKPAPVVRGSDHVREVKPNRDLIRRRAFEIYQERIARGIRGDAQTDWLQAERELLQAR